MPIRKKTGKKITAFADFESSKDGGGYENRYIRLVHIQLVCMNELSHTAFRVYVMMRDYSKGNAEFEFPHRIHRNFISKQTFTTAVDELVHLGYLEPFQSNKRLRKANKYRFSSKWRIRNQELIKEITAPKSNR